MRPRAPTPAADNPEGRASRTHDNSTLTTPTSAPVASSWCSRLAGCGRRTAPGGRLAVSQVPTRTLVRCSAARELGDRLREEAQRAQSNEGSGAQVRRGLPSHANYSAGQDNDRAALRRRAWSTGNGRGIGALVSRRSSGSGSPIGRPAGGSTSRRWSASALDAGRVQADEPGASAWGAWATPPAAEPRPPGGFDGRGRRRALERGASSRGNAG